MSPKLCAGRLCRQGGLTLVEMLVAIAIGLIVTLAVTAVLTVGERQRRSTTSTNDMGQSGAFAVYQLDRAIRNAGSGLIQSINQGLLGCKLNVTTILPRNSAFPAPFKNSFLTGATANLRIAPLLIAKSQSDAGSDVLVVMRANGSSGGVPRRVADAGTETLLITENSVGMAANDLLLLSQNGTTDCLMEQVSSISGNQITLGGDFYTAGTTVGVGSLTASPDSYATLLGNRNGGGVQFQLFGVGANATLFSYDLLQMSGGDTTQAIADGVTELHALYGLDINGDGKLDNWVDPGAAGYTIQAVMESPAKMREIVAVHIALVMRSSTQDGTADTPVAPETLGFFANKANAAGESLARSITLDDTARLYRHRVVETTVPLHNMQLLPAAAL